MKANLYINYYVDKHHHRRQELNDCVVRNVANVEIDHLYIVIANNDIKALENLLARSFDSVEDYKGKIKLIKCSTRPTYNDYFLITRKYSKSNELSILANTDMFFDEESLIKLKNWHWRENYCMALCRYDILDKEGNSKFFNRPDSQDVWIVKGGFKPLANIDFGLGIGGCDNVIAHRLNQSYNVIAPSKEIKTYHLHLTNVRNYINYSQVERVPPPYLQIQPTMLPE